MANLPSLTRAAVLTGPSDPQHGLHCYWEGLLGQLYPWDIRFDVLPAQAFMEPAEGDAQYPDWSQYHVIIVTVDSASGAPDVGGQYLLDYFDNRARSDLRNWVRDGGILFCEIQSRGGRPWQESYDSLLGRSSLKVLDRDGVDRYGIGKGGYENILKYGDRGTRGSVAWVGARFSAHPLMYGLHPFVSTTFTYSGENVVPQHRHDQRAQFSLYFRCPEILYSGWVTWWAFGWIPLLLESEENKWPVLLALVDGEGAWITSTLRLTTERSIPLIRNILNYPAYKTKWQSYHRYRIRQRRLGDLAIGASGPLILALAICGLWYANRLTSTIESLVRLTSIASLALGLSGLGVVLLYVRLIRVITRRPLGARPGIVAILRAMFGRGASPV